MSYLGPRPANVCADQIEVGEVDSDVVEQQRPPVFARGADGGVAYLHHNRHVELRTFRVERVEFPMVKRDIEPVRVDVMPTNP